MRYFLLFFLIIGVAWVFVTAVQHSSDVTITYLWDDSPMSVTLTSTTLLIITTLALVALYFIFNFLRFILGFRRRLNEHRDNKLTILANKQLTQGLIQFTEGHWSKSEKLLTDNVSYSETPLLNYLAASRAAHMQEAYDRRDDYLKTASQQGEGAQIAVAASQADMQFSSNQFEQARATLIHLLDLSPKHPYGLKLLAKIYYQQEDWNNLFNLLPDLDKLALIKENDNKKYQETTLRGIFSSLSHKKDIRNLQGLWKKLPESAQQNPEILLLYCEALSNAEEEEQSNKLLITELNKMPNEKLFERYGLIEHSNLGKSIKDAEKWLLANDKSPMLLLALARLNRKYQLWGKSKSYYNASLNFSPSAPVYLEFANFLEELGELENAELCYKKGLQYSINKKGEILTLQDTKASNKAKLKIVSDE